MSVIDSLESFYIVQACLLRFNLNVNRYAFELQHFIISVTFSIRTHISNSPLDLKVVNICELCVYSKNLWSRSRKPDVTLTITAGRWEQSRSKRYCHTQRQAGVQGATSPSSPDPSPVSTALELWLLSARPESRQRYRISGENVEN